MTDETSDSDSDPPLEPRERAILSISSTTFLVIGAWLGTMLVPTEAFADHITGNPPGGYGPTMHYLPVNPVLPIVSIILVSFGLFYSVKTTRGSDDD
jgi:hypothetical protein